MRLNLSTRITVAVVGVVALAVTSSVVGLIASRQSAGMYRTTADESMPSIRAAEELEIALLEQRGLVARYMLDDGNPQWLDELQSAEPAFADWLARARRTAHTEHERTILEQLDEVYRRYDARRREAIRVFDEGEIERAKRMLLREVDALYIEAFDLCESFIESNERFVARAKSQSDRRIRWWTYTAGLFVLLTVVTASGLLALLIYGVLRPLRQLVNEARNFAPDEGEAEHSLPEDELRTVGEFLRTLMSDVVDARTDLRRSRRRLMNAEKLASVGKLAASVAHEIRNPLTSMKMWLYSIRKGVAGDEQLNRKLDVVAEEITRLESIVRNFLEFSRPPALDLKLQDATRLIDKTLELIGPRLEQRGLRCQVEFAEDLPPVMADNDQLKQVLMNLLDNAAEATPDGGEIRITGQVVADRAGNESVVIRVHDAGSGMPEDVRDRIFEPFFSTKEDGTGLGLCVAARIMTLHGGRLVLESSDEQGTSFAVWIPTVAVTST